VARIPPRGIAESAFYFEYELHRTLGLSPFEVLFGVRPQLPLRVVLDSSLTFVEPADKRGEEEIASDLRDLEGCEPLIYTIPLKDICDPDSWLSWKECRFCPPIRENQATTSFVKIVILMGEVLE